MIPIDAILCRLLCSKYTTKYPSYIQSPHIVLDIRDTIHFKAIKSGDFEKYANLVETQPEHSVENFKKLIDNFDVSKMSPIEVRYDLPLKKYIITDGVHRISCLVHFGIISDTIPLKFLNIHCDNNTRIAITELVCGKTDEGVCHYNGWRNGKRVPYQSIQFGDFFIPGQRTTHERLAIMRKYVNFNGKTVVDVGCNIGANLFHLYEIKRGTGMDYDSSCTNIGRKLSDMCYRPLTFITHDFDRDSYTVVSDALQGCDIIILTSLGSWVKSWRQLYSLCNTTNATIIFETNNDLEGKPQLDFFHSSGRNIMCISENSNDDITGNTGRKCYVIEPIYKVYIYRTGYHPKNIDGLLRMCEHNKWVLTDFEEADLVFSASTYVDIALYPQKRFVFGPHFSIFPNDVVRRFNNKCNNAVYIQPSQPSVDTWQHEFKFTNLPMQAFAFPVDTDKFTQSDRGEGVLVYFKHRHPSELKHVTDFLTRRGVPYTLISYGSYKESDYMQSLKNAKYVVWVGAHESQGFALEEALATNVPMLVWSTTLRKQEYPYRNEFMNVKSNVTTIPYWDNRCGEYFTDLEDMESKFDVFVSRLENYKPREFVVEVLSITPRSNALSKLVSMIG